jgi:molecular chaperone GrpE
MQTIEPAPGAPAKGKQAVKENAEEKKRKERPGRKAADREPDAAGGGETAAHEELREEAPAAQGAEGAGQGPEPKAPGDPGNGSGEETLETRLERLTLENEQGQDRYVRLMADFENYRKRVAKEKADLIQYGNETLLKDLLPIIDNMERVLAYSLQEGDWKEFRKGVELVLTEVHKTLSRHGVEPLHALGKAFDPNLHEAMQRVETDQIHPDTVLEVFQKGYLYRERLLRPSLVAVAAPLAQADEPDRQHGREEEPTDGSHE